jgi:hypothetical protein
VPSSSALPNQRDEAARWHLLRLPLVGAPRRVEIRVRQWDVAAGAFADAACYELFLPDAKP